MLTVVKTYQGSVSRRLTPDDKPTFAGVGGDDNAVTLKFRFPDVYAGYTKSIRFNLMLKATNGTIYTPMYSLTNDEFRIPAEISSCGTREMTFSIIFIDISGDVIEESLPSKIWFAGSSSDDVYGDGGSIGRLLTSAFVGVAYKIDTSTDRPAIVFTTPTGSKIAQPLEMPYLESNIIPIKFLPNVADMGGVEANPAITPGTFPVITYDAKGLITAGRNLIATDIPVITQEQVDGLTASLDSKVVKNSDIVGGTNTKITYDAKGLVTAGTALDKSDVPDLDESQITGLTADLAAKALQTDLTAHIDSVNNPHQVTKAQVGLGHADDTSDLNKPISTATQTALDGKVDENPAIIAGTYPKITYDVKGLVVSGTLLVKDDIPNIDEAQVNNLASDLASKAAQTALDSHINNFANPHQVTKAQVGLSNADNTADTDKPVSTAVQTALDGKVDENPAITAGTNTKITYDSKGLVIAGTSLVKTDIPTINEAQVDGLTADLDNRVVKNTAITAGTATKITYDTKGLVTAGTALVKADIPNIDEAQVTGLITDLASKQNTLTFDTAPTNNSTNPVTSGGVYTALLAKPNMASAIITGDGTTVQFTLANALGVMPSSIIIYDSDSELVYTGLKGTADNIIVQFTTAPAVDTTYTVKVIG